LRRCLEGTALEVAKLKANRAFASEAAAWTTLPRMRPNKRFKPTPANAASMAGEYKSA
jgi:hypothetical protein